MSGKISRDQMRCLCRNLISDLLFNNISLAAMIEKGLRKTRLKEDKPVKNCNRI